MMNEIPFVGSGKWDGSQTLFSCSGLDQWNLRQTEGDSCTKHKPVLVLHIVFLCKSLHFKVCCLSLLGLQSAFHFFIQPGTHTQPQTAVVVPFLFFIPKCC